MLGNVIASALSSLSLSQDRVERWLGRPCHCQERIDKLNALDRWARRVLSGKVQQAKEYLDRLLAEQ